LVVERDELVRHYQVIHVASWGEELGTIPPSS
jgi:hypothetical protein